MGNNLTFIAKLKDSMKNYLKIDNVSFSNHKESFKKNIIPILKDNNVLNAPRNYKDTFSLKTNSKLRLEENTVLYNYILNNIRQTQTKYSISPYTSMGIYLFVANKDKEISLFDLFSKFTYMSIDNKTNELIFHVLGTPLLNVYENDKEFSNSIPFKKGELIYCGSAKNVRGRMANHLYGTQKDPDGMKFNYRVPLKEICECYYIPVSKSKIISVMQKEKYEKYNLQRFNNFETEKSLSDFKKDLEGYIHKAYGTRFGL